LKQAFLEEGENNTTISSLGNEEDMNLQRKTNDVEYTIPIDFDDDDE